MASVLLTPLTKGEELARPAHPAPKAHHSSPSSGSNPVFINPWPSYNTNAPKIGFKDFLRANSWFSEGNIVPIPQDVNERPVKAVTPDFDLKPGLADCLKATWIGHASWFIEFPSSVPSERGITLLLDPVFADRMSPVSFAGPKRFTPPACSVQDLPFVDAIAISHNHYDHLDYEALRQIWTRQKADTQGRKTYFFLPLRMSKWLSTQFPDIPEENIADLDWWEGRALSKQGDNGEKLLVHCTPSQHGSDRTGSDRDQVLWSSWLFQHTSSSPSCTVSLYFAGDTGYRAVPTELAKPWNAESPYPGKDVLEKLPRNPTFKHIGETSKGGADLALLPIGCFNTVDKMSNVHASPWDAVDMHQDLKARTSIAMHFGTIRGGISRVYEPIDLPVTELEAACKREGVKHGRAVAGERMSQEGEFLICDVGQTIICPSRKA